MHGTTVGKKRGINLPFWLVDRSLFRADWRDFVALGMQPFLVSFMRDRFGEVGTESVTSCTGQPLYRSSQVSVV